MKTRFALAAFVLMAFAVVSTIPKPAVARGPQPKGDFTINTSERADGWTGVIEGTWKMSGAVTDSGVLWGVFGEYDRLWLEGEFGTMMIWADLDFATTHTFIVLDAAGLYEEWIGAEGVWDYRGNPSNHGGIWWNSSRKLVGFLPDP